LAEWLTPDGVLRLHVQPGARRTEVAGLHGDRLKIRVAAPPVDGAANEELLRFLKERVGGRFELLRGHASRAKDVRCVGATPEALRGLMPD
jgi:uncharacterized protein